MDVTLSDRTVFPDMLDLSSMPEQEAYVALLLERDQLEKEAMQIHIRSTQLFGQLIAEKIACIRCKKTLAFLQQAINRGRAVNPAELKLFLDREMALYDSRLMQMLAHNRACGRAQQSTGYEARRSRELYRRLAKLLHPDVNPLTDRDGRLQELWQRILEAYGHSDLKSLSELEVLARRALQELGAGEIRVEIPDLDKRIEALKAEIHQILHSEPYTYRELLEDPDRTAQKKEELNKELEEYRKYHSELDEVIRSLLEGGGITFQWIMK